MYVKRNSDLTVEDGCVHWGFRVVILEKLQSSLLSELHDTLRHGENEASLQKLILVDYT